MGDKRYNHAADEYVDAISRVLGRFAARGKLLNENRHGVDVEFNRAVPGEVRFSFVTADDLHVSVRFDFAKMSREYINNMVEGLIDDLGKSRREKQRRESIIVFPDAPLVSAIRGNGNH